MSAMSTTAVGAATTASNNTPPPPPNNPYLKSTDDSDIIHRLGRSQNTINGDSPALRLLAFWRAHVANRPAEITETEIEEGNLEAMILLFCNWLGRTPIPKNCRFIDGNICPPALKDGGDDTVSCVGRKSLVKYVGRIIAWLRRAFPDHPDFKELNPNDQQASPDWWSRIKPKLENEIDDLLQRFDNDFSHGAIAVRPLYYKNTYGSIGRGDDTSRDIVSMIDLEYMLQQLFKDAVVGNNITDGPMQHRAWLTILYNAIGRPGEAKFIDTSNWTWHGRFDVVDIQWLETKTKSVQAMPMFPDKCYYLLDFYHAIGSYWAVEGGLFRTDDQSPYATYLFPLLHKMADNSVASKILNTIRDLLPEDMKKELKQSFSGKSLRQSSITELLIDPDLSYSDVLGRSGHESGTTIDTYQDKMNIATGIRGGKKLAHWSADADVKVPKLDGLPTDSVYKMMDKLFTISVPMKRFAQGGELHMVLRTCTASLIMYHNDILSDSLTGGTSNAMVSKLSRAANDAKISDERYPGANADFVLAKWSDEIKTRMESDNPDIIKVTSDGAQTAAAVNQQSHMLQNVWTEITLLRSEIKEKDHTNDAMKSEMQQLRIECAELRIALQRYEGTPGSAKKRKKATPSSSAVASEAAAAAATSGTTAVTEAAAKVRPMMNLTFSNTAKSVASGPKGEGVTISALLSDFSIANRLAQGAWKEVGVTGTEYNEPQCVKNTLELCQFVCTSEEQESIRNGKSLEKEALLQLADTIGKRAFDKMWTLEGKDPEQEKVSMKKKGSQNSLKPTYLAVGKRVRVYKQAVVIHKGINKDDSSRFKKECKEQKICERPSNM